MTPTPIYASSPTLAGATVGSNIKTTVSFPNFKGQTFMGLTTARNWTLGDGNNLSTTFIAKTGRILYVETDWNERVAAGYSGIPGLVFGSTTLSGIREKFGSNGYTWSQHYMMETSAGYAVFNSYGSDTDKNIVITFITLLDPEQAKLFMDKKLDLGDARLVAIAIADIRYLETIWGKPINPDANYKPVSW